MFQALPQEAIANELQGTGVTVTDLCPGPTESAFQARANMERSKLDKYLNRINYINSGLESFIQSR
jgi:short-subunit dehydrogenase